jgi:hypothetical protein
MAELSVQFQTKVEATAQDLRHAYERPLGEGVEGYSDMLVTPGATADTVDVTAGIGFVRGDGLNDLGLYRCRNDATMNSAAFEAGGIAAPDATKPRLDQIIARVYDDDVDSGGQRKWRLAVLKGTPTTGDTLDKREGAAAVPNSAMLLADVLVPAGAPAVLKAEAIRDRRPFCYPIVPPLLTDVDMVPLELIPVRDTASVSFGTNQNLLQAAVAVRLPRRILNATRLRWKYNQGSEAITGNYVLAIFDASGRKIVDTGSIALTGAKDTTQVRSDAISATNFEAGLYYVFFGISVSGGVSSAARFYGVDMTPTASRPTALVPNLALRSAAGGVTVPSTLFGMTDVVGVSLLTSVLAIPDIFLSVG